MRSAICAALIVVLVASFNGCSSSSVAQSPATVSVRISQFDIDGLTPLDPSHVLYNASRDVWITDYTEPGTQLFMADMTILATVQGTTGLVWRGNTFLIETNAFDGNNTSTAEIWITDGTPGGTAILETLNPDAQMFELLGIALEGDTLVVAFRINQPGVPSVFATFIERIALI